MSALTREDWERCRSNRNVQAVAVCYFLKAGDVETAMQRVEKFTYWDSEMARIEAQLDGEAA